MSTWEWICLMVVVGLVAFLIGKQAGICVHKEEASKARETIRSTLSKVTARYILEKRNDQSAGYYEGCYRSLLFCLSWMEDL